MNNNYCVIMAGGVGARFWPMSRTARPKQFMDVLGTGKTLIRQTFDRMLKICPLENVYVVTHELYKDLVLQQLPELGEHRVLLEPARRNTAPCIAYAAYRIHLVNPHANLVVAPSDHIILQEDIFIEKIRTGLSAAAENNWLITLGIKPSRPDTGYGYIQFMTEVSDPRYDGLRKVRTFTEKPDAALAETFIRSGDFLWNSGIFIWSLSSIFKAFEKYLPEVNKLFQDGLNVYGTPAEQSFIRDCYTICKSISIDYGIMEKAGNVYVIESEFGWSDLGTWGSLYEMRRKDGRGNTVSGKNVMFYDSTGCIVSVPDGKLAVLQGLEDYIIVEDDNMLLVCRLQDEQMIRKIVNDVKMEKGAQFV